MLNVERNTAAAPASGVRLCVLLTKGWRTRTHLRWLAAGRGREVRCVRGITGEG